ncbi:MAG: restriction endonuclease subunit S [Bacteroidales bacterium]|nr:restriction endonuclease subunit S [Bacteroidales bacterium]
MKQGWQIIRLGDLCRVRTGRLDANAEVKDGLYPFFTCSVNPLRINNYAFDCECVLVAGNGDLNVKYYEGKFNAYQRTYVIESNDKTKLDVKYLFLFLSNYITTLRKQAIGATIKYIKLGNLTDAPVPIPSLSEQQRIVSLLDAEFAKIDTLKANAEQNLQNAKDLFQAALKKELEPKEGWKKKTIKDVCSVFGRIGYRGYTRNDLVDNAVDGAITLSPSNIVDNEMVYDKVTYISWFKYEESPEIMIFDDDILLVKTGSSYGKCALVRNLPHKATINPQFVVLKNININRRFLNYYLRTPYSKARFDEFVSGTAIPTFSQANLGNMTITFPSMEDQQSIVSRLDALNEKCKALQANYEKTLSLCDDLKQALLRKAFNGEI